MTDKEFDILIGRLWSGNSIFDHCVVKTPEPVPLVDHKGYSTYRIVEERPDSIELAKRTNTWITPDWLYE